jgi:hypothetical protein
MTGADEVALVAAELDRRRAVFERDRDPRASFAFVYAVLTRSLEARLRRADTGFDDPGWVAGLATTLAHEYLVAMDAVDEALAAAGAGPRDLPSARAFRGAVPQPWRDVQAAFGHRSYVLEDELFSMMAHISYDLPRALRRMSATDPVTGHVADFHRMNDVLGEAVEGVQDGLAERYSRGLASLDRLFARQDELLTSYGIRVARCLAWYNTDRLADPSASAEAFASIGRSTGAFVREVRAPDDWRLRLVLHVARFLVPERRRWPHPAAEPAGRPVL